MWVLTESFFSSGGAALRLKDARGALFDGFGRRLGGDGDGRARDGQSAECVNFLRTEQNRPDSAEPVTPG
jgi:hypothetical protein